MSSGNSNPVVVQPAAQAAFLRGIQRRATVLAELQTGDAAAGDAAVAATIQEWSGMAGQAAMGAWPVTFWSLLLSRPQLRDRARTPVSLALHASDRLGELPPQPRAAVLLRLVAGLDPAAAALVQGTSEQEYLLDLQRALPASVDGSPDLQAWDGLGAEIKRRIRTLPPTRLPRPDGAREPVQRAASAPAREQPAGRDHEPRRRWWTIGWWILLATSAVALLATLLMR